MSKVTIGLVAVVSIMAGCGGSSPSATPSTTTSPPSTTATTVATTVVQTTEATTTTTVAATTTTVAATTTTSAPPSVPPAPTVLDGHVAVDPGWMLPDGFTAAGPATADGPTVYVPGFTGDRNAGTALPSIAESGDDGATWHLSAPSIDSYAHPKGFTINDTGFWATSVAVGAGHVVATGVFNWWRAPKRDLLGIVDAVWTSTGGATWQLVDLRPLLGGGDADTIQLRNLQWLDGRFFLTGADGPLVGTATDPARGLVLVSDDGTSWAKWSGPVSPWSVALDQVIDVGGVLVASGVEYVCDASTGATDGIAYSDQPRLWSTNDDGQTWVNVPIPADVVSGGQLAPADQAGCPVPSGPDPNGSERVDLISAYKQQVGGIGPAGTGIAVWSTDGTTADITANLEIWTSATVD